MIRFLSLCTLLILCPIQSLAQEKPAADLREDLRYDGKPFSYWEKFPRTELKSERRVDAVRAMAAFGTRGYGKEATAVIVELLKEYDRDKGALEAFYAPEKPTPEQRVLQEAVRALGIIGPEASAQVLAQLDHSAVSLIANKLYNPDYDPVAISDEAVPVLVRWAFSKNETERDMALVILAKATRGEALKAVFLATLAKEKNEKTLVEMLRQRVEKEYPDAFHIELLGALGTHAKLAIPALVCAEFSGYNAAGAAKEALAQIKPTPAERIPGLLMAIKYRERTIAAAQQLAEMGASARSAADEVLAAIRQPLAKAKGYHKSEEERLALIEAFAKIVGNKEALPVVADLLDRNPFPSIERDLVKVYLKLDNDPKQIVTTLAWTFKRQTEPKKATEDHWSTYVGPSRVDEKSFTQELAAALGAQGANAKDSVPLLLKVLEGAADADKVAIIAALGKIGPSAGEAMPMLAKLLQSPEANLRQAAAEAIEAITRK